MKHLGAAYILPLLLQHACCLAHWAIIGWVAWHFLGFWAALLVVFAAVTHNAGTLSKGLTEMRKRHFEIHAGRQPEGEQ